MNNAERMRLERLTSCNRDVDRMQKEMVDAQNEIRRLAYAMKDRGVDVDEDLKQAIEATDRMANKLSQKTYPHLWGK
jgi:hypothetical protein